MYEWFQPILTGALLTLLLLTAEHFLLWKVKLWLPIRYTLGVGALNAGATLAAGLAGEWFVVVVVWALAIAGGLLVGGLHAWRVWRGDHPADIDDAFAAGQLVAKAREGMQHGPAREPHQRRALGHSRERGYSRGTLARSLSRRRPGRAGLDVIEV